MDYYIVRIYRQEKNNPRKLDGVVEEVNAAAEADKKAFTSMEELWRLLNQAGDVQEKGRGAASRRK
jgi:hypothetical protein